MNNYELYHSGIKGMKWGVRRYQNKDGTLTAAGKKRRATNYTEEAKSMSDQELRSKIDRMVLEKRYVNASKNRNSKTAQALDAANKATKMGSDAGKIVNDAHKLGNKNNPNADLASKTLNAVSKTVNTAKKVNTIAEEHKIMKTSKTKLANMNDKQLRETVNRMEMEQQYASLKRESVSRGKVRAKDVLDIAGDVLAIGASATTIAVAIHNVMKNKK